MCVCYVVYVVYVMLYVMTLYVCVMLYGPHLLSLLVQPGDVVPTLQLGLPALPVQHKGAVFRARKPAFR